MAKHSWHVCHDSARVLSAGRAFVALYASFLEANREPPNVRLTRIKELLHRLPRHNLETFHVVARHLNAVASMEHSNMVLFSLSMLI